MKRFLFEFISAAALFSAMTLAVGMWESDKSGTRLTSVACLIGGIGQLLIWRWAGRKEHELA